MRIAVVFFSGDNEKSVLDISKGIASGLESQGHQVDIINGNIDKNIKLTIYRYIVIGTMSISFIGGKISPEVSKFLASSGTVAGKRSFAFVKKDLIRNQNTLLTLMKTMEHEGMFVKNSRVISSPEAAKIIGSKLNIK